MKEAHLAEAMALYDSLVQSNIQQFNRNGYRVAARYGGEVKNIYLNVLHDTETAARYIADICREHTRRPALREEFAGL